jgi:hypothetical protein
MFFKRSAFGNGFETTDTGIPPGLVIVENALAG